MELNANASLESSLWLIGSSTPPYSHADWYVCSDVVLIDWIGYTTAPPDPGPTLEGTGSWVWSQAT